jgi:glycosyltransferase involved in cell wall biosynthesis
VLDLRRGSVMRAVPALASYLRRNRPSALLSTLTHANIAAVMATMLSGRATRVVLREANDVALYELGRMSWRRKVLPSFMRLFYTRAAAIIGVSNGVAEGLSDLLGIGRQDIHVIPNAVDTHRVTELSRANVEHPWLAEDIPVVLAVGRLVEQKDYPALLRAFARASAHQPMRLIVLGEGEKRTELEQLARSLDISQHVCFAGFAANPFSYMARAKMFVLASRWEGLPNTLLEALACGCPVIATDCPSGPAEILDGGRYGRLVSPGDVEQLASAMLETMAEPARRDVLRGRASEYDPDVIAERYLSVLLESRAA